MVYKTFLTKIKKLNLHRLAARTYVPDTRPCRFHPLALAVRGFAQNPRAALVHLR